jgi:hypothetical protein
MDEGHRREQLHLVQLRLQHLWDYIESCKQRTSEWQEATEEYGELEEEERGLLKIGRMRGT